MKARRLAAGAILAIAMGSTAAAQLASRPVEEWRALLDAPERVAALKVDDVVAALKLSPADVVADLGAGTGPFVVSLARAVPQGTVYAVEVDRGFLPLVDARAQAAGVRNVRTVLGAFDDPGLPRADIDLAFMHDVLHHIADRDAYLRALARYLSPRARIAIVDYAPDRSPHRNDPSMLVSKAQARDLLAEVGFTPVDDIALFEDKWFVVFGRSPSPSVVRSSDGRRPTFRPPGPS